MRSSTLLLLALFVGCTSLQTGGSPTPPCPDAVDATVHFIVLDQNGFPIPDVEVRLGSSSSDSSIVEYTDHHGVARVNCIPPGGYEVTFAKPGFSEARTFVDATSGRGANRTVRLNRLSAPGSRPGAG